MKNFLFLDIQVLVTSGFMSSVQCPSIERSTSPGDSARKKLSPSSKETYSRKVFIGGLPPDIDEGIVSSCIVSSCPRSFTDKTVIHS